MDFELRTLCASDIFPMVAILNKIGFRDIKSVFLDSRKEIQKQKEKDDGNEANYEEAGIIIVFDCASVILGNLPSCEKEIFSFLASVTGKEISEIRQLPLDSFAELIIAVLSKDEFSGFFSVVSKYIK